MKTFGKMLASSKLLVSVCKDMVPYKTVYKQIMKWNLEDPISLYVIHTNLCRDFTTMIKTWPTAQSLRECQKGVLLWHGLCAIV